MAEQKRRLVAILAADAAGFSRLMAANEADTLARLKHIRAAITDPAIVRHGGRVVGSAGDSLLVEFASALSAVECAVEIQDQLGALNGDMSADSRMEFRIGVNLGDVIAEDETIYGDGVNVAARIEKLAKPGTVCISRSVYDQVKGKLPFALTDLGEHRVHNIPEPIHIHRVDRAKSASATNSLADKSPLPLPDKPSIAVLPFQNMSGDAGQQYFCDGITEDITTELSRFRQMHVASRHSSSRFRGPDVDMIGAGRELGVHYLLEGSVRRMGPRTRITAQLIDATTGGHLWAERYDSTQDEIFDVQDQVVRTIVVTLAGRMTAARTELAKRKPTASLAAYEHFLRGDALPMGTPEIEAQARFHFEKAVELDPSYARAYAMLSFSLEREWLQDMSGSSRLLDEALVMARKAISLDENDALCQLAMLWMNVDRHAFELAEQHLAKALALNPHHPSTQTDRAIFHVCMGEPEKAIDLMLEVRRLDPFFEPSWYWGELGAAYFMARRHEEAIASMRRATVLTYGKQAMLAASYAMMAKADLARKTADEVVRRIPSFSVVRFLEKQALVRANDLQHLAEGLRKAGLPE